jgi:hypothetical protein
MTKLELIQAIEVLQNVINSYSITRATRKTAETKLNSLINLL